MIVAVGPGEGGGVLPVWPCLLAARCCKVEGRRFLRKPRIWSLVKHSKSLYSLLATSVISSRLRKKRLSLSCEIHKDSRRLLKDPRRGNYTKTQENGREENYNYREYYLG
jgi:hypothetical protein